MVSPGRGKVSAKVVRSTLALPTTAMRGRLGIGGSGEFGREKMRGGCSAQTARLYHGRTRDASFDDASEGAPTRRAMRILRMLRNQLGIITPAPAQRTK